MNRLPIAKRVAVISALVEGCSVRSTSRITGVAKGTILRLLADFGTACAQYHDATVRNLSTRRIQADEIWSFCYAKKKNVTKSVLARNADAGDVWTWSAIDADSKLCVSWLVGSRDAQSAATFMKDIASRIAKHPVQLTTDQLSMYGRAVEDAFYIGDVDYGMLKKYYAGGADGRYSPAECIGCKKVVVEGDPDPKHISTSFVERQNLTMRMNMRRFTRLTNAFSKKFANHMHSVALFYMHYNFCRIHQSLRVTPAQEAGLTSRIWSIEDIVSLVDQAAQSTAA